MLDIELLCSHGLAVFPLRPGSKQPAVSPWAKVATSNFNVARGYFSLPEMNVGIATGVQSGGLVVIDVDTPSAVPPELKDSTTLTVRTPRGIHFYFRDDQPRRCQVGWRPKVDVRGVGGLVVGPGSTVHGLSYTLVSPDAVIERLPFDLPRYEPPVSTYVDVGDYSNGTALFDTVFPAILDDFYSNAVPGRRNRILFRAASELTLFVRTGYAPYSALDDLKRAALNIGLDSHEVQQTIQSAWNSYAATTT